MRRFFGVGEIRLIRAWRRAGGRMEQLEKALGVAHDRDELVEAIDATVRWEDDLEAAEHVNWVLAQQDACVPLINGNIAWKTLERCSAAAPLPPGYYDHF